MADSPEEVRKHIKLYLLIGAVLLVGTVFTVFISRFDFGEEGISTSDIIIGLIIASIKATCVITIFMHFIGEKKFIYHLMIFTVIFFISLYGLIWFTFSDPIKFTKHLSFILEPIKIILA